MSPFLCGKDTQLEMCTTRIRNCSKITHLNQVLTESQLLQILTLNIIKHYYNAKSFFTEVSKHLCKKIIFEIVYTNLWDF